MVPLQGTLHVHEEEETMDQRSKIELIKTRSQQQQRFENGVYRVDSVESLQDLALVLSLDPFDPPIHTLRLDRLVFNHVIGHHLAAVLSTAAGSLTIRKLSLQRVGFHDEKGFEPLASILSSCTTSVRSLSLGCDTLRRCENMGRRRSEYFANLASLFSSLCKLKLWNDDIGPRGTFCLVEAIRNRQHFCRNLFTLEIRNCNMGDEGTQHLATLLLAPADSVIRKLSLGWNQITDRGAQHLALALYQNQSLHTLRLTGNQIGDQGCKHLARALCVNSSLQRLYLGCNQIESDGIRYLSCGLGRNSSLCLLTLPGNNGIDQPQVIQFLDRALLSRPLSSLYSLILQWHEYVNLSRQISPAQIPLFQKVVTFTLQRHLRNVEFFAYLSSSNI